MANIVADLPGPLMAYHDVHVIQLVAGGEIERIEVTDFSIDVGAALHGKDINATKPQ
jgi:hypothetical protein